MNKLPTHLAQFLLETAHRFPDKPALHYKNVHWIGLTWNEVWQEVLKTCLLLETFVKTEDKVAIWSENRPEWLVVDMAIACLGAVSVPIYVTLGDREVKHILDNSGATTLVISNLDHFQRIDHLLHEIACLKTIVLLDGKPASVNPHFKGRLLPLRDHLHKADPNYQKSIETRISGNHTDRLATIIYTSGTTGVPKGVMLTHGNFIFNCLAVEPEIPITHLDTHLSCLPLSHVFERLCGQYLMIRKAASIYYAESMDQVPLNIRECRPTILMSVPRFYEKVAGQVETAIQSASRLKRVIFNWAISCGERRSHILKSKKATPPLLALKYTLAHLLVFRKLHLKLGGRLRFCVSGGAPLNEHIAQFFHYMGITIIEGYGLTETAPVITMNRLNRFKFGTVGLPITGVHLRIAQDGEILTQSRCVMKGYYKLPEATDAVIRDGWFYTGDIGSIDEEGFLKITGRKKEIIVTSSGKKLCPETIEGTFEKEGLIARCILYGEGKNFLTAIIVPDFDRLKKSAQNQHFRQSDHRRLVQSDWAKKEIETAIQHAQLHLARFEQIKRFHLMERDFLVSEGELTPTLKPRRSIILKKYAHHLERFYEEST